MLIVPLQKDVIVTSDGFTYRVIEYTNFKTAGPAVYVKERGVKTPKLVYFVDIASVNGVKVEFSKTSKLLKAFGRLDRKIHLPQPNDSITVLSDAISFDDGKDVFKVQALKLKSKSAGLSKGLVVQVDATPKYIGLSSILDIDRAIGSSSFNREEFRALYKDYMGV